MEAQLLRDMIADRDHAIEKIKRKSQEQLDRESDLLSSLGKLRAEARDQSDRIRSEKAELIKSQRVAYERLHLLQADFGRQCSSLHAYCKDIGGEKNDDPAYVMRMQAQLCKAMHSMGITDHQMELAESHAEAILKYQKEVLAQCVEEKSQTELKHMNHLMAIDIQQREAKGENEGRLGEILAEQEVLTKQIEENQDSDEEQSDDDDEEELSEEDKEAKEEMMRVLTERKQEIARLEKEQEENEDTISELEEQLEELDIEEHVETPNGTVSSEDKEEAPVGDEESDEETSDVSPDTVGTDEES